MKKRILLQVIETLQKRIEEAKEISKQDPYLDSYVLQKKLIQEIIDILKTTPSNLVELELIRWIQRQESAGASTFSQVQLKKDMTTLDEILQSENDKQMTLEDFIPNETPNRRWR